MSGAFEQLIQMGCNPILSQAALKVLKTEDLSALLDWISQHSEQQQKWTDWLKQNKEEGAQKVEAKTISHLVKKQLVDELMKRGHSKNVAQKSLLLTNNLTVETAEKWIEDHRYDTDFEQQLFLQEQQESNLSPEQVRQKLKELTEKAREKRKKIEEEESREREKNRVRYGKQMLEAKRIAEEQAIKRQVQLDKIQKRKDEQYKQKLLQEMRREKAQKLGKVYQPQQKATTVTVNKVEKILSRTEQFEVQCQQVAVGMFAYPDRAKTFFDTANIYVGNIIKNNGEQKTRKINMSNKAFQQRILNCFGGVEALNIIGFNQQDGFMVMKEYSIGELQKFSQILQKYSAQY